MDWLLSVFIAASIFGVGVTLIDLLGFFGHSGHAGHGGHGQVGDSTNHAGAPAGDHSTGHETGHGHAAAHYAESHQETSLVSQDRKLPSVSPLLRLLNLVRSLVYFCFGFGPTGLVGLASGLGALTSFLVAIPVGALFIAAGFFVRRLQTRELDSQVHDRELVLDEAEVIIAIEPGQIGKVRVELGGSFVERYARAKRPEAAYHTGAKVQVVEATDELLIVEDQYAEEK